jgi:CheY-like chemotaxis protein
MRAPPNSILIVEDDEDIRETLRYALEAEGYEVVTAADGKEGLAILARMPRPCLILLDLMMPVMNGWEFMDALVSDRTLATIPVVVTTAFIERADVVPAVEFLKKPVTLDQLTAIARRYCPGT